MSYRVGNRQNRRGKGQPVKGRQAGSADARFAARYASPVFAKPAPASALSPPTAAAAEPTQVTHLSTVALAEPPVAKPQRLEATFTAVLPELSIKPSEVVQAVELSDDAQGNFSLWLLLRCAPLRTPHDRIVFRSTCPRSCQKLSVVCLLKPLPLQPPLGKIRAQGVLLDQLFKMES